jgi:hypothetical protein
VADFLRAFLLHDQDADRRLIDDANAGGVLELRASA